MYSELETNCALSEFCEMFEIDPADDEALNEAFELLETTSRVDAEECVA